MLWEVIHCQSESVCSGYSQPELYRVGRHGAAASLEDILYIYSKYHMGLLGLFIKCWWTIPRILVPKAYYYVVLSLRLSLEPVKKYHTTTVVIIFN